MFYRGHHPLIIRRIENTLKKVFLSFDDGPCPDLTPKILDLLKEKKAQATFFVIGQQARKFPEVVTRMQAEGHAVLSHSIDHDYRRYFSGQQGVRDWIEISISELQNITCHRQNYFRPPAGVLTPPLIAACSATQTPLILWSMRFFDTVFTWTDEKARAGAHKLRAGDIVLLHDRQRANKRESFLHSLRVFLHEAQSRGFQCAALSADEIQDEVQRAT